MEEEEKWVIAKSWKLIDERRATKHREWHGNERVREGQNFQKDTFIDLKKAYDRITRKVIWRCTRGRNVSEKQVRLIQDT